MTSVCILDYGSGNVQSVYNLFQSITKDVVISNESHSIANATHLVLPGVGAFAPAMSKILAKIPISLVQERISLEKVPFLGICVGMQVLSDFGYEFGTCPGLGWIPGKVDKLSCQNLPLPHIGWNSIDIKQAHPLLHGLESGLDFYFVHSFVYSNLDLANCIATTEYGENFPSIIAKNNVMGVQFHPEKSQRAGIALARNFLAIK